MSLIQKKITDKITAGWVYKELQVPFKIHVPYILDNKTPTFLGGTF
jgi:hypothetical protein